jgi:hypothetical protein
MSFGMRVGWVVVGSFIVVVAAQGREWTDANGKYSIEADLFGFNDEHVVLQRADKELGVLKIDELSEQDREYLKSVDAEEIHLQNIGGKQTWTTRSGLKLIGRAVDYVRRAVVIQRRRSRMYVNDRAFNNLPEFYQQLVPKVVEHFEEIELPDRRALLNWLRTIGGEPRTFQVEGVILEVENGDEYAVPFFVFSEADQKVLKAGWENWLAVQDDYDERDDHAFRLEAMAAAHLKNQQIDRQIALMNLNLQAIRAGLTSAWEVTLYPVPGNPSPPRWVVMPGRNSAQATAAALKNNPGFVVGPVRRVSD